MIKCTTYKWSSVAAAPILQDICIQATTFSRVEYVYVPRNANSVAHSLAKKKTLELNHEFGMRNHLVI
jgi:hypothetical protein